MKVDGCESCKQQVHEFYWNKPPKVWKKILWLNYCI